MTYMELASFLNILMVMTLINCGLMLTVFPVICWFFVIPKIERDVGKKLKFNHKYDYFPLGKYLLGYIEVSYTLALMYLGKSVFKNEKFVRLRDDRALVLAGYNIESASRVELVISLLSFFCMNLFICSLGVIFLVPVLFPLN